MNLEEIKNYIEIKLNKNQNGWVLTPARYNILLNALNIDYYESKVQKPERPNTGYEFNKKNIDFMRVFKVSKEIPCVNGIAEIPKDYRHYSAAYYNLYYNTKKKCAVFIQPKKLPYIKDTYLPDRLSSSIQGPSLDFPIWTLLNNEITVYPKTIKNIVLHYLRAPNIPFFDYYIQNDKVKYLPPGKLHLNNSVMPVGTPSRSVEVEYPENYHVEVADWLYEVASTTLKDQLNIQLANQKNLSK